MLFPVVLCFSFCFFFFFFYVFRRNWNVMRKVADFIVSARSGERIYCILFFCFSFVFFWLWSSFFHYFAINMPRSLRALTILSQSLCLRQCCLIYSIQYAVLFEMLHVLIQTHTCEQYCSAQLTRRKISNGKCNCIIVIALNEAETRSLLFTLKYRFWNKQ